MSFPQPHVRLNSGSKLYWLACDKPVGPCENKTRNEKNENENGNGNLNEKNENGKGNENLNEKKRK